MIHVSTKNVRANSNPEEIVKSIIDIAKSSETNTNEVFVPGIHQQKENLNGKGRQVNKKLEHLCSQNHLSYISHDNTRPRHQCYYGCIHLNNADSKF